MPLCEGCDGALDLGRVAHVNRAHYYAERPGYRLECAELAGAGAYSWIAKHRHLRHGRRYLLEQLQPFRAHAVFKRCKAGNVAARLRQAIDEARADRIGYLCEHNWHGARRVHQRPYGHSASSQYDVRRKRDQFRGILANALGIASGPAGVDPHVAAIGPTELLQALYECHQSSL